MNNTLQERNKQHLLTIKKMEINLEELRESLTKAESRIVLLTDLHETEANLRALSEKDAKVVRQGNQVHVYMTCIRSHFVPDNIEGIKMGDVLYFHITNLEQDWDVPHGFAIKGANNAELLIMPGETATLKWSPDRVGVSAMYCTDFCSALHQEMQGYIRVSPAGSSTPLKWGTGETPEAGLAAEAK